MNSSPEECPPPTAQAPKPATPEKVPRLKRRPHLPAPRRFVTSLYVRATEEEKRRIEDKARRAGLSVSRYLVRAGAEDRLPPSREERTRLEDLMFRFKRASLFLEQFAGNAARLDLIGATASQQHELREASKLLASLAGELKKRL